MQSSNGQWFTQKWPLTYKVSPGQLQQNAIVSVHKQLQALFLAARASSTDFSPTVKKNDEIKINWNKVLEIRRHSVLYNACGIVMVGVAGMMGVLFSGMMGVLVSGIERNNGESSSLGRGSKKPGFQHISLSLSLSLSTVWVSDCLRIRLWSYSSSSQWGTNGPLACCLVFTKLTESLSNLIEIQQWIRKQETSLYLHVQNERWNKPHFGGRLS